MTGRQSIPREASEALRIIQATLDRSVVAIHLFGSAVVGGLRPQSDVDVLVIVDRRLPGETRRRLIEELMRVSGVVGNQSGTRPPEVTVVCLSDIVPWRYPPKHQLVYGEWLRNEFENGRVLAPSANPDLVIVLKKVRDSSIPLAGPQASVILDPVPIGDIRRAMRDSLSGLLSDLQGDERNVLLTLARMWLTAAEGEIAPKDVAAEWAIAKLPGEKASLLELARRGYLGQCEDIWIGKEAKLEELVTTMKQTIEACLAVRS